MFNLLRYVLSFTFFCLSFGCKSGGADSGIRVVGGEEVDASEEPVAVAIKKSTVYIRSAVGNCTGVLISRKAVLTAGHCVSNPQATYVIGFGVGFNDQTQYVGGENIAIHPEYNFADGVPVNDLAVITLNEPAPEYFESTSLIADDASLEQLRYNEDSIYRRGQEFFISGFGLQSNSGGAPGTNRFANLELYAVDSTTDTLILSSAESAGCSGDSGGPAYIFQDQKLILAGIMSLASCDSSNYFITVAIDLRAYGTTWIQAAVDSELTFEDITFKASNSIRYDETVREILGSYRTANPPLDDREERGGLQ